MQLRGTVAQTDTEYLAAC